MKITNIQQLVKIADEVDGQLSELVEITCDEIDNERSIRVDIVVWCEEEDEPRNVSGFSLELRRIKDSGYDEKDFRHTLWLEVKRACILAAENDTNSRVALRLVK